MIKVNLQTITQNIKKNMCTVTSLMHVFPMSFNGWIVPIRTEEVAMSGGPGPDAHDQCYSSPCPRKKLGGPAFESMPTTTVLNHLNRIILSCERSVPCGGARLKDHLGRELTGQVRFVGINAGGGGGGIENSYIAINVLKSLHEKVHCFNKSDGPDTYRTLKLYPFCKLYGI